MQLPVPLPPRLRETSLPRAYVRPPDEFNSCDDSVVKSCKFWTSDDNVNLEQNVLSNDTLTVSNPVRSDNLLTVNGSKSLSPKNTTAPGTRIMSEVVIKYPSTSQTGNIT